MNKSNKEIAVELTKAWLSAIATTTTNPNVTSAKIATKEDVARAFSFFYDKVKELDE